MPSFFCRLQYLFFLQFCLFGRNESVNDVADGCFGFDPVKPCRKMNVQLVFSPPNGQIPVVFALEAGVFAFVNQFFSESFKFGIRKIFPAAVQGISLQNFNAENVQIGLDIFRRGLEDFAADVVNFLRADGEVVDDVVVGGSFSEILHRRAAVSKNLAAGDFFAHFTDANRQTAGDFFAFD